MSESQTIELQFSGRPEEVPTLLNREWLVTNGIGGYASGTIAGIATRRYHSLLTANLTAPAGRYVMLNKVSELISTGEGRKWRLGGKELVREGLESAGLAELRVFRLESGIPVWRYQLDEMALTKWILMPYRQNTVHIGYRLSEGERSLRLKLRLGMHIRPHAAEFGAGPPEDAYVFQVSEDRYEIRAPSMPALRLRLVGARGAFTYEWQRFAAVRYRMEESLGYEAAGDLWSPGYFRVDFSAGQDAALIASTENWEIIKALDTAFAFTTEVERHRRLIDMAHPALREGRAAQLVIAADQFIIRPSHRVHEVVRSRAAGDDVLTVIAGYHWFTDWGRDTMISLEGLTLATGRAAEAGNILRGFGRHVRDGLIPNMFPEGADEGVYHTADATLWFFHALDRYIAATGDRITLRGLLPTLEQIVEHHLAGTRFGIGADPGDQLLRQSDGRLPLTWMDAKMGDWVVTPRRGKAVEINALWYNALRLLARWLGEEDQSVPAREMESIAARVSKSFNLRFWNENTGYLFDVVDGEGGEDPSCRPNQIFAVSLPYPVLEEDRWKAVVDIVRERLLTPKGLRTLSQEHPDYKANYRGDLRSRDAAYHQGTVWAWLIGPFIDAWLKVYPDSRDQARGFLKELGGKHLEEASIGSISEVFDAEPPFAPRGCIAQAWSVAEVLRSLVRVSSEW
ncbi:MAG: amylo-alpha-1,6-glucosidase [Syntrophobacteraceae bacterium]|nr:amylo-alpha-1,6-glucosidase [Syntrophobacteraceae bacterium]